MKKAFRLFLFALCLTVIAAAFTAITVSASATSKVVYVASNGTGDGSSPDSPLGNANGYISANKMDTYNAFYIALDKLKNTGGTIVVVGELYIDVAEARVTKTETLAPCEFRCPKFNDNVSLTLTSVYGGVDYRTKGAKLILDHDACNTATFMFKCNTTVNKINIEYKYEEGRLNSWKTPFILGGGGYVFEIGNDVNVTSWNTKTKQAGDLFPVLIGGHRYETMKRSPLLTVKSGTWSAVIAGSYGIGGTSYAKVEGNASLVISGGKIGTVIGTCSLDQPSSTVTGSVSIVATGGEIGSVYASNLIEYQGPEIKITLGNNCKVNEFFYAPANYTGDLNALIRKVAVTNNTSLKITPPETKAPETKPQATQAPDTTPETAPKATQPPTYTTAPETTLQTQNSPNGPDRSKIPVISPIVWILLASVAAIIFVVSFALNKIKLKILK